jgi:hypothetical protein
MSGLGDRHVWQTSLESGLQTGYDWHFWEFWLEDSFRCFTLHQLTQCIPHDRTELLGHK